MIGLSGCARGTSLKPVARVAAFEHHVTAPRVVDLAIAVKPVLGDDPRLEIEVRAAGDELPSRWVVQKSWAGDEEVLDHLVPPRFVCDGRPEGATEQDLDTHVGWALPNRCASMTARYALRPAKASLEWGYEFDVVVTPQLVTAIGETALLLPDVPDETSARVVVTFDLANMPKGTEAVYSLGAGHHETSTRALRHAYLAMGKFKTEKVTAGNLTLEARFPADFDASTASRDLGKLLAAEADVFRDARHEDLRLMVIGMPGGGGAHGTSLTASALLWRDGANTWSSDDARLAAHEMFHLYNGQVIERSAGSGTDAQTYWFSEGFTEHYTDELMKRSGVYRPRDWFHTVRDRLRRYHHHPYVETANDKADMRWGGPAVQLPYLRGSIVAAWLDARLKNKGKSLDDFMRRLLARARSGDVPVDPDEMVRLIGKEVGADAETMVRAVAFDGKRLFLPADAFGSCVEVTSTATEQDLRVRPGVDLDSCMRSGG
jgi:hypothetical protein